MSTLYHMDSANLFAGDDDETGNFLRLQDIKLLDLKETKETHDPAGGSMAIDLGMGMIEAPTFSFGLKGFNADIMAQLMPSGQSRRRNYTVRGNVVDIRTEEEQAIVAVITGRMMSVEPNEFDRKSGIMEKYEICEIVRYEVNKNNQSVLSFDFFTGAITRNGVRENAQRLSNLGVI